MKRNIEAVIDEVIVEPDKIQPIIVNFQNGQLKDEEAENMECELFYDKEKKNTLLALSNGQTVYQGYRPQENCELIQTMLMIHNKRTGKVRLVKAERWHVTPVLHRKPIRVNNLSGERVHSLGKQFGSKKVIQNIELIERIKMGLHGNAKHYDELMKSIKLEKRAITEKMQGLESTTKSILPNCNRDAKCESEIYNIDDIVPETKLKTLYPKAEEILEGNHEGRTKFLLKTLKSLKTDPDRIKKIALLLYIEATAKWLNMLIKDAKKRGMKVCSESTEINNHIIDNYSMMSASGRTRPNSMRDKGLIHCIILALIACNYTLDLEKFITVLSSRIGYKKLTELARLILALPDKNNKKLISLKLPLPQAVSLVKKTKKK